MRRDRAEAALAERGRDDGALVGRIESRVLRFIPYSNAPG
jgi:hypothetical protein